MHESLITFMILLCLDQLINPTTGISTQTFSTTKNSRSGKVYILVQKLYILYTLWQ